MTYGPKIDEIKLKQIPTNVDAAVELIDVSVVNWGGIEKFSKWHDSEISNLRADYLFNLDQEVFYIGNGGQVKAIITNVYSVPYYYDIVRTGDAELKNMSPEDIKQNTINHIHSSVLTPRLESLKTWSEGLQMYNFDNSIHDLTLVIDDNIKSGRVTKLLKRQRRRAFLAQLRYLFVNNNPSDKDYKDPDGPMEIFRFEGLEQFYYLLDRPEDASRMIKSIFNTNISINVPLLDLNIAYSPSVKLLNLDEWPRMYVILKSILQKYADKEQYLINALNNTNISGWKCIEYDIENKTLIEGDINEIGHNFVIRKDASGKYRKFISNRHIYEKVGIYYIIKGTQQNLDFLYMNYLNEQDIPGRNGIEIPMSFDFIEAVKDALLKYFLTMLTFISIVEDKAIRDEEKIPDDFEMAILHTLVTDMCNTLYVVNICTINNKFDNDITLLRTLCEIRTQHVKKMIDTFYDINVVTTNPTNLNKLRLSQQLRSLNKIGEWLDINPGQANTVEFAKNNQVILELEACKGFYDTILNGTSDYQNFNKVTVNVTDKDKFKTFKERLKDIQESSPELYITFNDDNVEGYNRMNIDYDSKYTFDGNLDAISINIYSDLGRIYDITGGEEGEMKNFLAGERVFEGKNLQDPMNMWGYGWVGTEDGDISRSLKENREKVRIMFNNVGVNWQNNEMGDDSIFKYFEPVCTCQMLVDSSLSANNKSIFKNYVSEKLKSLTDVITFGSDSYPYSDIDTNTTVNIPNGVEVTFSPKVGTFINQGQYLGVGGGIIKIMTINVINTSYKTISSISESWGSLIRAVAGGDDFEEKRQKINEISQKFFSDIVELRWNSARGPVVKPLNLNYANLSNIWGNSIEGDKCSYFCIMPSINSVQYRKMILDTNSIYVKNTLIERLQSFGKASDITSSDIERVKEENDRLKEQVQTIQTQATTTINNYQMQNQNLQQQAQNAQSILNQFSSSTTSTVEEAIQAMKQVHNLDTQVMYQLNNIYRTKLQSLYQKCNILCQNIDNVVSIWNSGAGNYLSSVDPYTTNQLASSINGVYYGCQNMTQADFEGISDDQLGQAIMGNISGLEQQIGSWISSKQSNVYSPPQNYSYIQIPQYQNQYLGNNYDDDL